MARKSPTRRVPDYIVVDQLKAAITALEDAVDADAVTWVGPIQPPAEHLIRRAVEYRKSKRPRRQRLAMILDTRGGYIETAERIANALRSNYRRVIFMVPDQAMSAGTVLAMAGDEIWMNYYSTLGPIDPQIERKRSDGTTNYVPALGYLAKYEELVEKSRAGTLTSVEAVYLTQNFDPAELYQFQQAKQLSIELLKEWLVKYKFKNWRRTKTTKRKVTPKLRRQRAEEIGEKLSNTEYWCSHSRGISAQVLRRQLNLEIEGIEKHAEIKAKMEDYWHLLCNYVATLNRRGALHTHDLFHAILEA